MKPQNLISALFQQTRNFLSFGSGLALAFSFPTQNTDYYPKSQNLQRNSYNVQNTRQFFESSSYSDTLSYNQFGNIQAKQLEGDDWFKPKFYDQLVQRYDLFVWDFDQCIIKSDSGRQGVDFWLNGRTPQQILDDFGHVDLFRNIVIDLVDVQKKKVGIASFGYKQIISTYMKTAGLENYIKREENIKTPVDLPDGEEGNWIQRKGKYQMLSKFCEQYQIEIDRVIFFDDDIRTLRDMNDIEGRPVTHIYTPRNFKPHVWYDLDSLPECTEDHFSGKIISECIIKPFTRK